MKFKTSRFCRLWFLIFLGALATGWILSPSSGAEQNVELQMQGGCTSIMVGRLATVDGSVITSQTVDGPYRTWMDISPHRKNEADSKNKIYNVWRMLTKFPDDERRLQVMGEIPDVAESYSFFDTAYPAMNEHQLGIGETTIVGRTGLHNPKGLFLIEEIERLMLERCRTAREAIRLADDLTKKYGYMDYGESLTIADPKEVWLFEIMGATEKHVGAVWAAVRIPDDHVGVSANISRIGKLDLNNPDYYMASANVYTLAEEMGWWDPKGKEPFRFYRVYGGRGKDSPPKNYWTPREWRVLSLAAPSLNLDPNVDELPFSVKAEKRISIRDIMAWFRDTYENTQFDMTPNFLVKDRKGILVKSPVVSPWMSYDMKRLLNTLKPETVTDHYAIANNSCSYSTVIQVRNWLPDPIGGIVWLGFDNPAHSARVPLFCGITDLPPSFKICDQHGFTTQSAAWAFRRVSRLAELSWGKTRDMIEGIIKGFEDRAFAEIPDIERKAVEFHEKDPDKARAFLTAYSCDFARAVTQRYWELGDELWDSFARGFFVTPEELKKRR